jgi:hypothetical protein
VSLLDRITDRIHAQGDADLRAQGLTVTRLPGGRRQISHPDIPAMLEARRRRVITQGLDQAERLMLDRPTLAALDATRAQMDAEHPALRYAA